MEIIMTGVTINEVSQSDKVNKTSGEIEATYRNIDIFIPRCKKSDFGKSEALTARVPDSKEGVDLFKELMNFEGEKVTLLGDYQIYKNGSKAFTIFSLIDAASIKPLKVEKVKAA